MFAVYAVKKSPTSLLVARNTSVFYFYMKPAESNLLAPSFMTGLLIWLGWLKSSDEQLMLLTELITSIFACNSISDLATLSFSF